MLSHTRHTRKERCWPIKSPSKTLVGFRSNRVRSRKKQCGSGKTIVINDGSATIQRFLGKIYQKFQKKLKPLLNHYRRLRSNSKNKIINSECWCKLMTFYLSSTSHDAPFASHSGPVSFLSSSKWCVSHLYKVYTESYELNIWLL